MSAAAPPRVAALAAGTFDVAIIGGGIIGCGIARDAALRGLSVVLFDRGDFGGGTTAGSTRIIHGGLRYLGRADFRLVRMDLRERETLLRIAPHLVRPLEFVIPFTRLRAHDRLKLRAGLALYDALAAGSTLPRHRASRSEAAYYDARVDSPERLAIENLRDARAHGAQVFNYVEVCGAVREGARLAGLRVRDRWTDAEAIIGARVTVNATGPWLDHVASVIDGHLPRPVRTTKGIHLVCPPLTDRALVLFSRIDRRLMFAIPRLGQTWLGTTDTDYSGDPADAVATLEDVEYVLESLRDAFPSLTADDVLYTTAGVRALVMQGGRAATVSRLHQVVDGERVGVPGLIAIMGGKLTAYRAIAEEATDVICRRLRTSRRATTAEEPLPGARGLTGTGPDVPAHLHELYGSLASDVLRLAAERPALARPLSPKYPDIGAQVAFAARHEWCLTVADFLRHRSLLGATADQGWDAVSAVAAILAQELGWTDDRRGREIEACALAIEKSQSFRALPGPRAPGGLPR